MWKKILLGVVVAFLALGGLAYFNREAVILKLAERGKRDFIPPNKPISWQQGPATAPNGDRPPNIVFILADDLGYNDISTFGGGLGNGKIKTPNIDALAASGVSFTQAYSGTSSCAPSRAMIMTGRYPTRTGFEFTPTPDGMAGVVTSISNMSAAKRGMPPAIFHKDRLAEVPEYSKQGLPGSEVTLAEVLKGRGYHTVHIGKWHTGLGPEFGPTAQGFDENLLMASALHLEESDPNVVNARLDFDPIDKFLWARMEYAASFNNGEWFKPRGYLADYWTDEAIGVIKANKNQPFFLSLNHWTVHTPLQATKADYDAVGEMGSHRERVYAGMIRALDRSVGRIVAALKEEGQLENTIIVFSSDNGGPGYIGLPQINHPYRGWKLTLFEGGIRVPLFMSWKGKIPAGTRQEAPVAHIDLMPTLAAAAGADMPKGVAIDGVNILPFARGQMASGQRPHDTIFWQSEGYRVVRQGDWKLQVIARPKTTFLYDLSVDPTESRDLAAARPDKVKELTALLDAHQASGRKPLYPAVLEGPIAIDKTSADQITKGDLVVYWPN